jgi:hypothetical protein
MSDKAEAYAKRAIELEELAAKTTEPSLRRSLIEVARSYRRLVQFMQRSKRGPMQSDETGGS